MQKGTATNFQAQSATPYSANTHAVLTAKFGLLKYILLSMITFGIYGLYSLAKVGDTLNHIAGRYDGKRTMSFWLLALIIGPLTLGVGYIVWYHKMSARVGKELDRRNVSYSFGSGTFWLWNVLGALIIVGPFIYLHKLFKAMNLLVENYNTNG